MKAISTHTYNPTQNRSNYPKKSTALDKDPADLATPLRVLSELRRKLHELLITKKEWYEFASKYMFLGNPQNNSGSSPVDILISNSSQMTPKEKEILYFFDKMSHHPSITIGTPDAKKYRQLPLESFGSVAELGTKLSLLGRI